MIFPLFIFQEPVKRAKSTKKKKKKEQPPTILRTPTSSDNFDASISATVNRALLYFQRARQQRHFLSYRSSLKINKKKKK